LPKPTPNSHPRSQNSAAPAYLDSARTVAFQALRAVHGGAYTDVALDRALKSADLKPNDRGLATEIVYGCIRRQRTLDTLVDALAKKPAAEQPPDLRTLFHLGLYQLRYLDHIPPSAAVNTTVEIAKTHGMKGLAGVVNGLLRQYLRLREPEPGASVSSAKQPEPVASTMTVDVASESAATAGPANAAPAEPAEAKADAPALPQRDPLTLPADPSQHLGVQESFPDWIVEIWRSQLPPDEIKALAEWFNQPPSLDLRINPLKTTVAEVQKGFYSQSLAADFRGKQLSPQPIPHLPQGLRLRGATGAVKSLPGFEAGWWMVQDASAQLVAHLLDPQPGETVIDACAAPGGKTVHIAELMQNTGVIWAVDRTASRLRKVKQNAKRLGIKNIRIQEGDSRDQPQFKARADRVLVDAPCSGLGTLHRHADARWRQNPDSIAGLAKLQREILNHAATWVKKHGLLVYATCTLNPVENEAIANQFLQAHPQWQIEPPPPVSPAGAFALPEGWVKVWPHKANMDGFFMLAFRHTGLG